MSFYRNAETQVVGKFVMEFSFMSFYNIELMAFSAENSVIVFYIEYTV